MPYQIYYNIKKHEQHITVNNCKFESLLIIISKCTNAPPDKFSEKMPKQFFM